jgi:hypothetical protein
MTQTSSSDFCLQFLVTLHYWHKLEALLFASSFLLRYSIDTDFKLWFLLAVSCYALLLTRTSGSDFCLQFLVTLHYWHKLEALLSASSFLLRYIIDTNFKLWFLPAVSCYATLLTQTAGSDFCQQFLATLHYWHELQAVIYTCSFLLRYIIETNFRLWFLPAVSCYPTLLSPTPRLRRPHESCTQHAVQTNSVTRRWGPVSSAAKITAMTSADRCPHQNVGEPKNSLAQ